MSFGFAGRMTAPPLAGGGVGTSPAPDNCQFTICFASDKPAAAGPDPARLLRERLRIVGVISAAQFRNIHLYVGNEKTLAIAIKSNGEHVVQEDETNLFPSDRVVAAFHLLLKAT